MKGVLVGLLGAVLSLFSAAPGAGALLVHAVHMPVAQLFMQLASEAEVNVLVAGDMDATVHVQWQNVGPTEALLKLCQLPQLSCQWLSKKNLLVASVSESAKPQMTALVEPLAYASAVEVVAKLQVQEELLAGGRVVPDEEGRQLLMWLPENRVAPLRKLIQALDKPMPQVQIEARILIASRDAGASLRRGLEIDLSRPGDGVKHRLTASAQVLSQTAGLALGVVAPHILLNLELAAMEATGQVMTLAQPQVLVQHLAQGRIETGQEVPYVISGEDGTQRQWKQAVLGLTVTPRVLSAEQVELDLSVVQDSVGELLENGELALNTHRLHTQVRMASGQTIVLGGALYEQQLQSLMENPAWMGLPFMQRWWHSQQRQAQSFELLVFVTPRLIARI